MHFADAAWDISEAGAIHNLCNEVIRILNRESGNVLVFLPSVAGVQDATRELRSLLTHDPATVVLPLFAGLELSDRELVERFADRGENRGRRMVCFATNVAEAGITIPGVTAVVDCGLEMSVTFDIQLRANVASVKWISQASHLQRRGRAGRTAPGRCYCLFTQEEFDAMPAYSTPEVMRKDCQPFFLSIVAAGHDPARLNLMDYPVDRMEAARRSLVAMGAIEVNDAGTPTITPLGKAMARMPVPLPLAKAVVAGVKHHCSEEVAIIAAVVQASTGAGLSLFYGSNDEQKAARGVMGAPSGDHETALVVYETWASLPSERQHDWCDRHSVNARVMRNAADVLVKLCNAMAACELPMLSSSTAPDRMDRVVTALLAGMIDNVAVASNPERAGDGFRLMSGFESSPVVVRLHPQSVIATARAAPLVIYGSCSVGVKGDQLMQTVTVVTEEQVKAAGRDVFDRSAFDEFRALLGEMRHETREWVETFNGSHERDYAQTNVADLKRRYPLAVIKTAKDRTDSRALNITLACPRSQMASLEAAVRSCVSSAEDRDFDITGVPDINKWAPAGRGSLTQHGQQLQQELRTLFGFPKIVLVADRATATLRVRAPAVVLRDVVDEVTSRLGMTPPMHVGDPGPRGTHLPFRPATADPAVVASSEERARLHVLRRDSSQEEIYKAFGRGCVGGLLAVAHWVLWYTPCFVYGGFVRDYIVRGEQHDEMDLDIGLPVRALTPADMTAWVGKLKAWLATAGLVLHREIPCTDSRIKKLEICVPDGRLRADGEPDRFLVEVVNTELFQRTPHGKGVDFDVNNLKLGVDTTTGAAEIKLKRPELQPVCGDADAVCANVRRRRMTTMRDPTLLTERIQKFQGRGWTVVVRAPPPPTP